jgi:hypothetical protein
VRRDRDPRLSGSPADLLLLAFCAAALTAIALGVL